MFGFKRIDFDDADRTQKQDRPDRANVVGGGIIKGARAVFRALGRVAQAFAEAKRQHALYEQLSRMTDRELRDAGISRSDIPAVVAGTLTRKTGWQEPKVATAGRAEPATVPAQADERLAA